MKTRVVVAVSIGILLGFLAVTPLSVGAPSKAGSMSGLTDHELQVLGGLDYDHAWSQFEYLSSLGEKTAGSDEERAAQRYVYDTFTGMTMDEVRWETFPVANWKHYGTTVLVAEVVDVGYGTAVEFDRVGDLGGAIALVHRDDNIQAWPNTPAMEAGLHGASAVVFYGYYSGADNPDGIKQDSVFSPVPGISISPRSAWHIQELLESGPVTLEISGRVDTLSEKFAESVNVAAVMWGTTRADEYVVISGHIDTWWWGSNDDCSSIAAVLEFARLFSEARASGTFTNGRTLVFASVGSEETGGPGGTWYNWLVGSYEFVQAHPEIMEGLVVELNMDGVSFKKSSGRYWAENTWEINGFVAKGISDLGLTGTLSYYNPVWSWTDAWSFAAKGGGSAIEMIGWSTGFDVIYHTQLDSIEAQDPAVLRMVLRFYGLLATRAVHALVVPLDFVPTCDWAAGYLASERRTVPSEASNIDAASAVLASLRTQAVAANAYAAELTKRYAEATTPEEKAAIWEMADEFNAALIGARRIITPYTLGEGGTMGSWDVFLRSDQHAHDYGLVNAAVASLGKNRVNNALAALESVYTMEWGKYYSRETYRNTIDDMVHTYMYWGDDFDQQQMYVDVHGVYLGLKDGSMSPEDARAQLLWIRDNQLVPWFEEDLGTLQWAWNEGAGILAGAVA